MTTISAQIARTPSPKYDAQTLRFRRQFVLGPRFLDQFADWKRINIGNTMCLSAHPDLGTYQASNDEQSVTLLGFILDPEKPDATDVDIVNELLRRVQTNANLDDFIEATFMFGGRWILIVNSGREARLFHDAAGLRQVFYTESSPAQATWCASDAGVIAQILRLSFDAEARSFLSSYQRLNPEYWWPADSSPYPAVRRLLPNHYLNLSTRSCQRYWPKTDLPPLSLRDCVERSAGILTRTMDSARKRFQLALTVTAGWDSRVALAATRHITNDVLYFTLMYWDHSSRSDDIRIPSRLLPRLGLRHYVIKCPTLMEDSFAEIYNANVTTAHKVYGTIAQGLLDEYPRNRVMVKAVVSESGRSVYRERLPQATNLTLTPQMLATAVDMEANAFVLAAYDRWLSGIDRSQSLDILELLFWEQRMGSWQSMAQLEWDIVQDVFTPFNCRSLMTYFLSIDSSYRVYSSPVLHWELAKRLWPEVLSEPINPSKKKKKLSQVMRQLIIDSPIRQLVPRPVRRLGHRFLYPQRRFTR